MESYRVVETFLSFQGEGLHIGRRAFFIRLFGCNVKCAWCDSKYAWKGVCRECLDVAELVGRAAESRAEIVVITGGEPCLHDLSPLLSGLAEVGIKCHLETSGTSPIVEKDTARFDWVALSPKLFMPPREDSLLRADELKMIVSDAAEIPNYVAIAERAENASALWLEPEWSKADDVGLLRAISDFVVARGGRYRAGWQMHKNYFVR